MHDVPPTAARLGGETEVGRLEPVDLRYIWKHEALEFTPWLAQNLDRLSDALNIPLDLEAVEHSVGPFSLDILATTADGAKVIIENQLEPSDHRHLGQCLTYAAGVGASVVVWVLPRLLPEHRSALDWLNEHTDEAIQFFGVEVSAVRIGQSLPAPMFAVEARPNDWQKQVRSGASASSANPNWRGWEAGYAALKAVPAGRWTAIQDISKIIGTTPAWVARHLYGKWHLPNLHRLLVADGSAWKYFQWADLDDQRTQREALEAEGVVFDDRGCAAQRSRMTTAELTAIVWPEAHG